MGYTDNRLRRLIELNLLELSNGTLTTSQLSQTCIETMTYKEPAASDIRLLLGGLTVDGTSKDEIRLRLNQALRALNLNTDYS